MSSVKPFLYDTRLIDDEGINRMQIFSIVHETAPTASNQWGVHLLSQSKKMFVQGL